jgi:Streptomycin adenylyltransferase
LHRPADAAAGYRPPAGLLLADNGGDGKPRDAKEICARCRLARNTSGMTPQEFEARITDWARARPDVEALIQIGSRVQPQSRSRVDAWSDWDYHLVVRDRRQLLNRAWVEQIAPGWCVHLEGIEDGVTKVGCIFENGLEADFVLLVPWQMKLVYWAMARPGLSRWYPRSLRSGIHNTQRVLRPGYKVICGGPAWEKRLRALEVPWPERIMSEADFTQAAAAFWRHAVWLLKKIARGELRAAARWYTLEMFDHIHVLLAEEARLAGRRPRTEARSAEQWLDAARLRQTEITTAPDRRVMTQALLAAIGLFEEVSASVAAGRGFKPADHAAVAAWLRAELAKLAG